MKLSTYGLSAFIAVLLTAACGPRPEASSPTAERPLMIEGAMPQEVTTLVAAIEHRSDERIGGWKFWSGTLDGHPVVVVQTLKGMSNAAAATAVGVERFHPVAIINQGTAGGHQPDLHVLDIVVGVDSVNLGSFKTPFRKKGQGADTLAWSPLDLLRSEGSAGIDPLALRMRRHHADKELVDAALSVRSSYTKGRVVEGVIGSADVWNSELDRIARFHEQFGTSVEEMETASAAQIAAELQIPFGGIRVLSNNITNDEPYDRGAADACQVFVRDVARAYFTRAKR